jgi:type IV pilus assembly protein PilM
MLGLQRRNLVGLDLDTSTVRMVQLRKEGGGYVVTKAAVCDIAPWGDAPQLRKLHTVQAIRQALASANITSTYAVCGLCGPEVVVRDFEFPPLTPEEIAGAVELEISQICPFLAEESTFDYQVTSSDDKQTMGFWVAATNDLIESTRQLVSEAGLHCALVDVAGLALLNLLRSETGDAASSPSLCQAVLNLGDSCVSIAIADPAGRPFVRDIGSRTAQEERPTSVAGRLATHSAGSSAPRFASGNPSFSVAEGWAARSDHRPIPSDSLVEDTMTTLRYYTAQNGSARVDRLLVCGVTGATEEAAELLRARLPLEVEPWNPLVGGRLRIEEAVGKQAPDDDPASTLGDPRQYGPSLAVATGLAMRSI